MMTILILIAVLVAGALVTWIGAWLIGWIHPPRGRFVEINGLRQHVVELGEKSEAPPIVLIHGAGCNLEDMRLALGERLAPRHRVILIDRPGLGWSTRSDKNGNSPAYQAAMLRDVLDRLEVERAIIVGHSWGGALAARFALDFPDRAAALVLLAPPLYPIPRRGNWLYVLFATPYAGWIYARTLALPVGLLFLGLALASAFLPQLPPRHYLKRSAAFLLLRPATFLANARDMADITSNLATQPERYSALTMPTLLMTGYFDLVVQPMRNAFAFATALPRAKLVTLAGIGHMLHHVATDQVIEEIEKLISQVIISK
jgi:pimeloyl-ACP methyl ester carboxylesterase